jgi:hypothetical protein
MLLACALSGVSGLSAAAPQAGWVQVESIEPDLPACCQRAVALADGVCVASGYGTLSVFERDAFGAWVQVASFTPLGAGHFTVPSLAVEGGVIAAGFGNVGPGGGPPLFPGLVIVYERDPNGIWAETARFSASDGVLGDQFGSAVALSGDTIAVGAAHVSKKHAAYVFERDPGNAAVWNEVAKLQATLPTSASGGYAERIDVDQRTLVISDHDATYAGTNWAGAVYLYERDPGAPVWTLTKIVGAPDASPGDRFGRVSLDGDRLVVGAPDDQYVAELQGLALDPLTGGWLASDRFENMLYRIDPSGTVSPVGPLGHSQVWGLASDVGTNTVYASKKNVNGTLLVVSANTGAVNILGPIGFGNVRGLAFDPGTGTLYGADNNGTPSLIIIDTSTGAGSLVGPTGFNGTNGLAFDPASGILYGITGSSVLVTIDTASGAGTAVGTVGLADIGGLEFDSTTGLLMGTIANTKELVSIDPLTGQAGSPAPINGAPYFLSPSTFVKGSVHVFERDEGGAGNWGAVAKLFRDEGPSRIGDAVSLAGGVLATTHYDDPVHVYELDPAGVWSHTAELETTNPVNYTAGLSFSGTTLAVGDFDPSLWEGVVHIYSPPSVSYCTAGTSANGCRATLSAAGVASATTRSGFVLTATDVEGKKSGHFYFGVNGVKATPWGNGTSLQCIVPPVRRAPTLPVVGTTGQCDGLFAQDLNALWCPSCPKPQHNPGPGTFVQAQFWYRDPQNTSNRTTSLSDAIESFVTP